MSEEKQETLDSKDLYREETFTDRKLGSLRRMTPVDAAGNDDPSRETIYMGSAQVYTPGGALPLSFEIEANSLEEAAEGFGAAAKVALDETMEELRELQRQQASSIVVPGQDPGSRGPAGGGIQLP